MVIETARLVLRPWQDSDLPPFAAQNADPHTMRFVGGPLSRDESDAYAERARRHFVVHAFSKWAVEAPGIAPFIGAVGLTHVAFDAAFTPAVEVAWRLDRRFWGQGYATEAARAAIDDGRRRIGLGEIVAMTALVNWPSRRVMERLGMTAALEFNHPKYPLGHPLCRHVLYRLEAPAPG